MEESCCIHVRTRKGLPFILTLLPILFSLGCRGGDIRDSGLVISTTMPFSDYIKTQMALGQGKASQVFSFPYLKAYDEAGHLIYSGTEAYSNARFVTELLAQSLGTPQNNSSDSLDIITDEVPAFHARKQEIVGRHRKSLLSISLAGCDACSFQDRALDDKEKQLSREGIDLLILHVQR